jgi:hypothetical protein
MPEFDPIAIGDKIRNHLQKADKAKASQLEHVTAAGVLLLDVKENHPEELETMCQRIELGRSRRAELLMIASGKRTQEETAAKTKARVDKHRAEKKAKALPKPEPEPNPLQSAVTDSPPPRANEPVTVDDDTPEASAERRKAEYAAIEKAAEDRSPEAEPGLVEATKPQSASVDPTLQPKAYPSRDALTEFKVAADRWLPTMSDVGLVDAIDYALAIMHRLTRERRAAA